MRPTIKLSVNDTNHKERSEKLTEVGTADHNLSVGSVAEDRLGISGAELRLEIAVQDQWESVTWQEPQEATRGEDDASTLAKVRT